MKDAKILIVEDDSGIVEISTTALSESYELIEASDGREAFNLFKQHKPDLVITDIFMPRKDGLDLIEAIRNISDVPIIVESGGNIATLKHYFDYHRVAYPQPFTADELRTTVKVLSAVKTPLSETFIESLDTHFIKNTIQLL